MAAHHKMGVLLPLAHVILKDSRHASLRGDGPGVFRYARS